MAFDHDKKRAARRAYVSQGLSLEAIAEGIGTGFRTVQRWKEHAKARGDDWTAARGAALHAQAASTLETAVQGIAALHNAVGESIKNDASASADEKLDRLAKLGKALMDVGGGVQRLSDLVLFSRISAAAKREATNG